MDAINARITIIIVFPTTWLPKPFKIVSEALSLELNLLYKNRLLFDIYLYRTNNSFVYNIIRKKDGKTH